LQAGWFDSSVVFDGSNIEITASGRSSTASADIYNASGTVSGITVEASGANAFASADIEGSGKGGDTLTVSGNISVTASGTSSDAGIHLENLNITASTLHLKASVANSNASAELYNVNGTVVGYTIEAIGTLSDAGTYVHGSSDLTVGTISVMASGTSSDAQAHFGHCGDATNLVFTGDLSVTASGNYANAYLQAGSFDASVVFGDAHMGSAIAVNASGDASHAEVDVYHASGAVSGITVEASGANAFASADIEGSGNCGDTLTVSGGISVTASGNASEAYLDLSNITGNVHQLTLSVSGNASKAEATIHGVDSLTHVDRIDFIGRSSEVGDLGTAAVHVYQSSADVGASGGVVYASAHGSGDLVFNLDYYGGGRAGEIHLGYADPSGGSDELFNFDEAGSLVTNGCSDVSRTFNLALEVKDADLTSADADQLLNERLRIWGSDLGETGGDDTIVFKNLAGETDNNGFSQDTMSADSMVDFLSNADSALDADTHFYFGVVDGDGYLAYDGDGVGITMLIEFHGMTSFYADHLASGAQSLT
jgi:hypothetical protein